MSSVYLCTVVNFDFGGHGREAQFAFSSDEERTAFLASAKPLGWHTESKGDYPLVVPADALSALPIPKAKDTTPVSPA